MTQPIWAHSLDAGPLTGTLSAAVRHDGRHAAQELSDDIIPEVKNEPEAEDDASVV